MKRDLEIDLLRSFVAVASHLNFTRAAQSVSRTQSAVSLQIKRLEDIVGRPVFERTRQSVSITPTGEALLVHANRILLANDAALSQIQHPEATGRVRIGAPDDYATLLLPTMLSVIEKDHPLLQIDVVCENTPDLLDMLDRCDLDIVIAVHAPNNVSGQIARYEPLHWVASPNYADDPETPLSLALWPTNCVSRELALDALKDIDRDWRIRYSTRSIGLIERALLNSSSVGVMEASCIPDTLRIVDGQVGLPPLSDVAISIHRSSEDAPHITHVSGIILAMFGNSTLGVKSDRDQN